METTIQENLAGLASEIANAEATRNEVVAIMARREKVPAELYQRLLATSPGVSLEDIQAKVNRQIADSDDVVSRGKAGDVVAGPLRDAQRAASALASRVDRVGQVYQSIGARLHAVFSEWRQQATAQVTGYWLEANRLRSNPNRHELEGRQRRLSELRGQLASAEAGCRETMDGRSYGESLHNVAELKKQLEVAEATPFEFSSEVRLPPPLESPDVTATVVAIVVDELQRAIPAGQQGDVFGRIVAAFQTPSLRDDMDSLNKQYEKCERLLASLDAGKHEETQS
jgi:hypothetical protein